MRDLHNPYIGIGIYSLPDAARISRVPARRIARWTAGYSFVSTGRACKSGPVWKAQLPTIDGRHAIGFLDLLEVRAVDAFRQRGVTWAIIRRVECRARERIGVSHPFCTLPFMTDGRDVFLEVFQECGETGIVDFLRSQMCFERLIRPYLAGLEFDGLHPSRWWPLGENRRVLIDPARCFGQPIVDPEGVPTQCLAQAYWANRSYDEVALWYDVSVDSVRDAIKYEVRLAA